MDQTNDQPGTTEVETTKVISGKTVFSITKPKPVWAAWMFRAEFIVNKMVTFYFTAAADTSHISVKNTLLLMATIDMGTWMLANSLGVKKTDLGLPGSE